MRTVLVYFAYLVLAATVAVTAFCGLLVFVAGWALSGHDGGVPFVGPKMPPASRLERLRARLTVCRREGHTFRLAFPIGRLAQQCTRCGAQAPRVVVRSFRKEVA